MRFVSTSGAAAACKTLQSSSNRDGTGSFHRPDELLFTQRRFERTPAFASLSAASCASLSQQPAQQLPVGLQSPSRQQDNVAGTQAQREQSKHPLQALPFGTTRGKSTLRYVWDGKKVVPVDNRAVEKGGEDARGRFQHWVADVQDWLQRAFLPNKKDVTPDYWEWVKWRLMQRFFSSTIQNLSTQSLLMALGMGAKRTIAASAAINWLLKDGVGRIARMTVATNFGQTFDSDLKRIRFSTSLIFEGTIVCEFITPLFPHHFLALASLANVGKAIALSAFVATTPAFQQALCAGGNLADLTAKNQAQHMMVDMFALGASAAIMHAVRGSERSRVLVPLAAFPLLAACDLFAIYRELKSVELKTLNRERGEMIAERWISSGTAPTPAQISREEHLLLPPDVGEGFMPLSIVPIERLIRTPEDVGPLQKRYGQCRHMLAVHMPASHYQQGREGPQQQQQQQQQPWWEGVTEVKGDVHDQVDRLLHMLLPWRGVPQPKLRLSLSEEASSADILEAILEASYLRLAVKNHVQKHLPSTSGKSRRGGQWIATRWSSLEQVVSQSDLENMVRDARVRAVKDRAKFLAELQSKGWKVQNVLLSTKERQRYVNLSKQKR